MAPDLSIDPARSAVVTLDLQQGVVSTYVKDPGFLDHVEQVLGHARGAGVPVIHVKVAFRPGVPEASPRNVFLSTVKASAPHQRFFANDSGALHGVVGPAPGDLLVSKNRISAFAGTDLDWLLRANDRHTIIVFGIATGGAVLSTVLQAVDLDYRVVVVRDCCTDLDEPLHAALMDRLFPRAARVVSSEEIQAALARL